ncbi:DUF922 domain-containing protein [Breoghania sp.]|uniref:DUF922 domain-containing protein n=1 Tax=Breoghania sp. TaxID=2065378 RepID=UPI002AA63848|nr:DUF922 domain-containing protein [Breoghania sp.]
MRAMSNLFVGLCLTLIILGFGTMAYAEIVSRTDYKTHPVSGVTPAALVASMKRHPIPDAGDEVVMGLLVMDSHFTYQPIRTRNGCRVGDMKTQVTFTIILPRATHANRFDRVTKRLWNQFTDNVKGHELAHRQYFLEYAAAYERRARRIRAANCRGVDMALARIAREEFNRAQRRNDRLDRKDGDAVTRQPLFVAAERERPGLLASFQRPSHPTR